MDAYRINDVGSLRNDAPFHLNRFLLRISDEFSRKSVSKGLILYSEHNGSNVTVNGDADKLEQVLAICLQTPSSLHPKEISVFILNI